MMLVRDMEYKCFSWSLEWIIASGFSVVKSVVTIIIFMERDILDLFYAVVLLKNC